MKVSELEIKNNKCTTPMLAEIYSQAEIKVIDLLADCGSQGPLQVHCQLRLRQQLVGPMTLPHSHTRTRLFRFNKQDFCTITFSDFGRSF